MFINRERRGRDRFLRPKLACLVVGAVLGLIGMGRGSALLVDLAIVVILAGFALRFMPHTAREPDVEGFAPEDDTPAAEPHPPARR